MSACVVGTRSKDDSNGDNKDQGDEVEENVSEIICAEGQKQQKKRRLFSSSSSSSAAPARRKHSSLFSGLCCVCLVKLQVLESDFKKNTAGPDAPEESRFERLKFMIEKNDFYSEECNTHHVGVGGD